MESKMLEQVKKNPLLLEPTKEVLMKLKLALEKTLEKEKRELWRAMEQMQPMEELRKKQAKTQLTKERLEQAKKQLRKLLQT